MLSPSPRRGHLLAALLLPAVLLVAAGCSQPAGTVSGEVTLDGKPLTAGYVSFAPADGKGPVVGGPISDGRYNVSGVPAGSKVVTVQSTLPPASGELSSGDAYAKGAKAAVAPPVQDAVGNNQALDVVTGPQTFDVKMTTTRR